MSPTLEQLLELQQQTLNTLSDLLAQEKHAITKRNSESISALAKQKLEAIQCAQKHDAMLAKHPEATRLKTDEAIAATVAQLKEQIAECQKQNEVNGEALQRAQLSFHKLNNLFQQSRGKQQMTYNAEGVAQNVRSLGTNLKA